LSEPFSAIGCDTFVFPALELTPNRTLAYANQRSHEHATLEHLLLALTDDGDACAMMDACKIDVVALKVHLTSYIDNELKALVTNDGRDSRPQLLLSARGAAQSRRSQWRIRSRARRHRSVPPRRGARPF
jgi:ATP-dependent Clp protease ATP-binding subunit ClpA